DRNGGSERARSDGPSRPGGGGRGRSHARRATHPVRASDASREPPPHAPRQGRSAPRVLRGQHRPGRRAFRSSFGMSPRAMRDRAGARWNRRQGARRQCLPVRFALAFAMLACALALPLRAAEPSLADAVEAEDRERIRALLEAKADVNAPQPDGMTALHWAVFRDDLELTAKLFACGADANATNRYGVSPLAIACENGSGAIVEALLERGADPHARLRGGETMLMVAARTGRVGPVKCLIR